MPALPFVGSPGAGGNKNPQGVEPWGECYLVLISSDIILLISFREYSPHCSIAIVHTLEQQSVGF